MKREKDGKGRIMYLPTRYASLLDAALTWLWTEKPVWRQRRIFHRTEIAVLLLEPILIFSKEPLKIIKEYPIKNRMFRMTLVVDSCHGRETDS